MLKRLDPIGLLHWPMVRLQKCQWLVLIVGWLGTSVFIDVRDSGGAEPSRRSPWKDSRVVGSPEPPLPFVLERVYPKQEFKGPVAVTPLPGTDRLVVVEQKGRMFTFSTSQPDEAAQSMCDFEKSPPRLSNHQPGPNRSIDVFSITFHPNFIQNRLAFVCYIVNPTSPKDPTGTHIARFRVTEGVAPRLDLESEQTILTCGGGGHNGCTLAFGPDGCLYISIGDLESPTPPDPANTGQDITDLYSSILRIDVDHPDERRAYSIPKDNPFVHISGARHEVYSYGFRNPWRMSFDNVTGDLWVGDVGWEVYEMVYRVRSGGNYGWSVKEGPGDVKPNAPRGPSPILPPDIVFSHADAASVTGGFVYRGKMFPELQGKYIFGDWITRRFWSAEFDRHKVAEPVEIAASTVKPICFAIDHEGELLILDYSNQSQMAGLYRLVENPEARRAKLQTSDAASFPKRLSQTGLFSDTKKREPASGVARYELNAPMFADGAQAEYLMAIPGDGQAVFHQEPQTTFDWFKTKVQYPLGTVLAKTYTVVTRSGEESSRIALETQLSHYAGVADWRFYSYRWNEDQSDAMLVPAAGDQRTLALETGLPHEPVQQLTWHFAARGQCRTCHTTWVGESIGMIEQQLRRPHSSTDSWRQLIEQGYAKVADGKPAAPLDQFTAMSHLDDTTVPLSVRARSYLHTNCAHCHMFGANGSAAIEFPFDKSLAETKAVDVLPMKGDYGLPGARLIAPGSPSQSLVLFRMSKSGTGRMPHIGSQTTDPKGVALLHDWIIQLPREEGLRHALDRITAPHGKFSMQDRMAECEKLLSDPLNSLALAHAVRASSMPSPLREKVIEMALQSHEVVRDAFEPLAKSEQRLKRLGAGFDPGLILAGKGDPQLGKQLFQRGVGQCNQCHRTDGKAISTGPDLSQVGSKYTREKILEHILVPSAQVDANFQAVVLLLTNGNTLLGRVLKRTDTEVVLQPSLGEPKTILLDDIDLERKSDQSLMPADLLNNLTQQQASDLLAFLCEQKAAPTQSTSP